MEMSGYGYIASARESFDSIALEVYGDEEYAKDLLMANPQYGGLMRFKGGEIIALPVVEDALDPDTLDEDDLDEEDMPAAVAPWKR